MSLTEAHFLKRPHFGLYTLVIKFGARLSSSRCIRDRGVHEDRKHDEDCEGGEKWDLPVLLKSYRVSEKRRGFEDLNGKRREEPAFATIPTVSA